ncbi:uncharacterized protein LTR77_002148 [Saxophila tyrrhenica]|uniref:Uncharacterized protein n=1 Tax=Saxophila tyrrhenica TaxID=1690608 RepID=A0AAV9PHP5_9PEZI|nr:hypothetical protein LTR77_002148 [Saxophila tyrrhenica]
MPSRIQAIIALSAITQLPENADEDCPICAEEYEDAVQLPSNDDDRGPTGDERIQLVARAFQHSGLSGDQYDEYSDDLAFEVTTIQRAAGVAYTYLAADAHPPPTRDVLIHMGLLGPHIIAMANLLKGYARAAGWPYSGFQNRDWKLIVQRLIELLFHADGQTRSGEDVVRMAREYRGRIRESLSQDLIDIHSGRFFEANARMDSPCGDLDVLLEYVVARCANDFQDRRQQWEDLAQDQQEALQQESGAVGYGMRWLGQAFFGGV